MSSLPERVQNHLLAALPEPVRSRLICQLESVDLPAGKVLYESGGRLSHVHFPTTLIASILYVTENGSSTQIAAVGREGVVGIASFMGGGSAISCGVVQSGGSALRCRPQVLLDEFNRGGPLLELMLRYTQALITQTAQTAVCNRHHTLDQQLCRWLLLSLDRLHSNEIVMTHEFIANLLGVRREGVTEAAGRLQLAGVISYKRGRITVVDRDGLEQRSCECYGVVRREYDRLLPLPAMPDLNRYAA